MKEANYGISNSNIIFKEPFLSDAFTRQLGGTPVNGVTYNNWIATTSWDTWICIDYIKSLKGVYTIRIKLKINSFSTANYIFDWRFNSWTWFIIWTITTWVFSVTSWTVYVNWNQTTSNPWWWIDLVVSWITLNCTKLVFWQGFGHWANHSAMDFELIEIYKWTLTHSEIRNMYQNRTFRDIPAVGSEWLWVENISDYSFESWITGWASAVADETRTMTWNAWLKALNLAVTVAWTHAARPILQYTNLQLYKWKTYRYTINYTVNSWTCILSRFHNGTTTVTVNQTLTWTWTYVYDMLMNADYTTFIMYFNGTSTFDVDLTSVSIKEIETSTHSLLLDIDPRQWLIETKWNTITNTATTLKKAGVPYVMNFKKGSSYLTLWTPIPLQAMTLCAWVKSSDNSIFSTKIFWNILSSNLWIFTFYNNNPIIYLADNNFKYFTDPPTIKRGYDWKWHFWVWQLTGNAQTDINNARMWCDWVELAANTTFSSGTLWTINYTYISSNSSTIYQWWNSKQIWQARIYSWLLTQDEITQLRSNSRRRYGV